MRKLSSVLTLILVACLTIGGVSAAWVYATGAVGEALQEFSMSMNWGTEYKISFINNGQPLLDYDVYGNSLYEYDVVNSTDAKTAGKKAADDMNEAENVDTYIFSHWINNASIRVDKIDIGNTTDITLYPAYEDVYTAIFANRNGSPRVWYSFTADDLQKIEDSAPTPEVVSGYEFSYWQVNIFDSEGNTTNSFNLDQLVENYNNNSFTLTDITIYPIYTIKTFNGSVALQPIIDASTGEITSFEVIGYPDGNGAFAVEIPNSFDGIPVQSIADGSLSSYDDLHSVLIPSNITYIGETAFADAGAETVTFYYQGDKAAWDTLMSTSNSNWDNYLGDGSRVFFLDENNKVAGKDTGNYGYYELNDGTWVYHDHAYTKEAMDECGNTNHTDYGWGNPLKGQFGRDYWGYTDYDGNCTCNDCNGAERPDAKYWK